MTESLYEGSGSDKTDSVPAVAQPLHAAISARQRRIPWHGLWLALTVIGVLAYAWQDLRDIGAGLFYLAANRVQTSDPAQAFTYLDYAEWLVPDAGYVHSKRGYLYVQPNLSLPVITDDNEGQSMLDGVATDTIHTAASITDTVMTMANTTDTFTINTFAINALEDALNFNERDAAALNNLAQLRTAVGETASASRLQDLAVIYAPNNATVRHNHGLLMLARGDAVAAVRSFQESVRINPGQRASHRYLALSYLQQGEYERAELAARQALLLDAYDTHAYNVLIRALYYQQQTGDALDAAEEASQLLPNEVTFTLFKALLLRELGDMSGAQALLAPLIADSSDEDVVRLASEILAVQQ